MLGIVIKLSHLKNFNKTYSTKTDCSAVHSKNPLNEKMKQQLKPGIELYGVC